MNLNDNNNIELGKCSGYSRGIQVGWKYSCIAVASIRNIFLSKIEGLIK
jgi:hypothetical protein